MLKQYKRNVNFWLRKIREQDLFLRREKVVVEL